ncbi:MAG TPA: GGDEF domain-containing protein [Candidatus Limnocylindrales bacterium]|nr:GGDEF domain-containing protein [Candidatus Limnocylindrales bacterium]
MSVNAKIFKILYRLTLPGGLLLVFAVVLIKVGLLADPASPLVRYAPLMVYAVGLGLSAYFRRSRLFFTTLVLALAGTTLTWVAPHVSSRAGQVLANGVAILLPINFLVLAFVKERGIISPTGRKRLAIVALEIIAVALLCIPAMVNIAARLEQRWVPEQFSKWSHLSQPALLSFMVAFVVIMFPLVRRYRAVESSLLWALISCFVGFRLGVGNYLSGIFFATGGLAVIVALIETSYSMAYLDELTQLPSRRALNEALMKLPDNYTVAMLDVDHFKNFNDSYGHESGDQALRLVASRLARIAGGGKAYRYGGEEFAVLFSNKPPEEVFVYLDRMRKIIEQSTFVVRGKDRRSKGRRRTRGGKKETHVTVSIGVASSNGEITPTEVLRIADQALYRAKARGRNCTVTINTARSGRAVETGMKILSVT